MQREKIYNLEDKDHFSSALINYKEMIFCQTNFYYCEKIILVFEFKTELECKYLYLYLVMDGSHLKLFLKRNQFASCYEVRNIIS